MKELFQPNSDKTKEKKPRKFLNNFFLNLPGGIYRDNYGKHPESTRLMDAIDKLLKEEFPNINIQEIFENRKKANSLAMGAIEGIKRDMPKEEQEKLLADAKIYGEKVDTALQPLFQRLVDMGFEEGFLMR